MTESDSNTATPRVLIPITIHFAIRYVVRTGLLARIRESCQPVLALSWDDPELVAELRSDGVEVVRLPDGDLSADSRVLLHQLDAPFARRLHSPSTAIDRRRRHVDRTAKIRFRRWLSWQRANAQARRPGWEARVHRELEAQLDHESSLADNLEFLDANGIEAVFSVTPFTIQELVVLKAAERRRLPLITSILSFDNITTRPPLPVIFDRYIVWNRFNGEELLRGYATVTADQIAIAGPAQFDFYADPENVLDEETWRRRVGLPPGAATILYGAGPISVAPHEGQYVDDLCHAIDRGALPDPVKIVLRPHPNDHPDRWERFRDNPSVVFDEPGALSEDRYRPGQVNFHRDQIVGLCSSLAHTDVHVSVSSTMTLDGACFGKPQIGPAYDRTGSRRHRKRAIDLYRREHFVPIVESGGLELAFDADELVAQVRSGLAQPDRLHREREAMLRALCTFTDGGSTARVATEVLAFVEDQVSASLAVRSPGPRQ